MGRKACSFSASYADKKLPCAGQGSSSFLSWHICCRSTTSIHTITESVSIFWKQSPERFNLVYGFHFSEVAFSKFWQHKSFGQGEHLLWILVCNWFSAPGRYCPVPVFYRHLCMGSVPECFVFWRRGCHFFSDGLLVHLFGKESKFGCALLGGVSEFKGFSQ